MMTMNTLTPSIPAPRLLRRSLLVCLLAGAGALSAQVTPVEAVPPEVQALETAEPVEAAKRISASFETLAGSEENARSLVDGLRSGGEITLTSEVDGQTVQRTFSPATGEQGYGNVFLALGLAEQELVKAGVTEPTAAQLEAALNGGVITVGTGETAKSVELAGVLALRADGQGWGQIAREIGVNPGQVVSNLRRNPRATEALALRAERPERGERVERPERPARAERVERVERVARVERPMRAERVERPVRPERPERPGRP
jgi:hypothetical protein